jgi:hypothetical protein
MNPLYANESAVLLRSLGSLEGSGRFVEVSNLIGAGRGARTLKTLRSADFKLVED